MGEARERKFVQVTGVLADRGIYLLAVADDGTAWLNIPSEKSWEPLGPLPPAEEPAGKPR